MALVPIASGILSPVYVHWLWRHEQGKHADLLKLNNEISKNALILISCHQALHRNTLR